MPDDSAPMLNPPIEYSLIWLIIGLILLALCMIGVGVILWITRRKKLQTITNLAPATTQSELDRLKAKYLQLIEQCYVRYQQQQVTKRGLHRDLSMTVRYFVYEARHFPAPQLTLSDLKKSPFHELTKLIEEYYVDEFAAIEHGDPGQSVQAAKDLVTRWV